VVLVAAALVVMWAVRRNGGEDMAARWRAGAQAPDKGAPVTLPRHSPSSASNRQALAEALGLSQEEIVTVGGVDRPRRDVEPRVRPGEDSSANSPEGAGQAPSVAESVPFIRIGVPPRLTGEENSQVAGLMAELANPQATQTARSKYFKPEAFDPEAYRADPEAWLSKVRPARAFYPAQPAPDVTPLATLSRTFQKILQGEKVVLRVKADPGMPVAFYTPQVGHFDNLLTTYTVAADDGGIATATYVAGPGSYGLVDILAASPVHSGQIQYRIQVELPSGPAGPGADQ
jgi:hypothetical protein